MSTSRLDSRTRLPLGHQFRWRNHEVLQTAASCSVCGGASGRIHTAREMMFGTRELFLYFECAGCGCLQLAGQPPDPAKYYSSDYYAFQDISPSASFWRAWPRKVLTWGELRRVPGLRFLRRRIAGRSQHFEAFAKLGLRRRMKILDVGCGNGNVIYSLRELGFQAEGADPYIPRDLSDRFGTRVRRAKLNELAGRWDLIMLHHALEHMRDHRQVLQCIADRLAPNGRCMIRIPIVSHAWKTYGANWVQLDPPRHQLIHTPESLRRVAAQAGLIVDSWYCDSTAFQFWGSELYLRNIPLRHGGPHLFSSSQLRCYERDARRLNRHGKGDQAVFILRGQGTR